MSHPTSRTDLLRWIAYEPGNPVAYFAYPTLRFAEFSPAELSIMTKRSGLMESDSQELQNQASTAFRLSWGREIRRQVLPASEQTRSVTFEDVTLTFQCGDGPSRSFFERVLVGDKLHEAGLLAYLKAQIRPGDLLVDIGAHVGYVSCFAAAFGATVLAVEMQPTLVPVIAANAAMNELWRVHPVNAAAGSSPGLVQTLRLDPTPGLMAHSERVLTNDFPPGSVNHDLIMRVAIDDLVLAGHPPPAFVKVDVEGAEGLVVAGATRLVAEERTRFLVEIHPQLLGTFGTSLEQILAVFPKDRWSARLLRDDGTTDDVAPENFASEAAREDNYMIVFEPLSMQG